MRLFRKDFVRKSLGAHRKTLSLFLAGLLLLLMVHTPAFADYEKTSTSADCYGQSTVFGVSTMPEETTLAGGVLESEDFKMQGADSQYEEQLDGSPVLNKTATQVGDGLWQIRLDIDTENTERPNSVSLDIAIVLDVSTSMDILEPVFGSGGGGEKSRLDIAKEASVSLVEQLVDDPPVSGTVRVSLITFSKEGKTILPLEDIGDGTKLIGLINSLSTESYTYIHKGLDRASYELFENPESFQTETNKYTILLGDGEPSGATEYLCEMSATSLKEAGSRLICVSMFEEVALLQSLQDAGYYQCGDHQGLLEAMGAIQDIIKNTALHTATVVDPMGDNFELASYTVGLDDALADIVLEGNPDGGSFSLTPGHPQVLNWELSPSSTKASMTYYVKMKDMSQVNTTFCTNGAAYLRYTDASNTTPVEKEFPVPEVSYDVSILSLSYSGMPSSCETCERVYYKPVFENSHIELEGPRMFDGYELKEIVYTVQGEARIYGSWNEFLDDQGISEAPLVNTCLLNADFAEERGLIYVYKKTAVQDGLPESSTKPQGNAGINNETKAEDNHMRPSEGLETELQAESLPISTSEEDSKKDEASEAADSIRIIVTKRGQAVLSGGDMSDAGIGASISSTSRTEGDSDGLALGGGSRNPVDKTWSLVNLLLATIASLVTLRHIMKMVGSRKKRNTNQGDTDSKLVFPDRIEDASSDAWLNPSLGTKTIGILTSVSGLTPIFAFFLLENLRLRPVFDVNSHTVPIALLTSVWIILLMVYALAVSRDRKKARATEV